MGLYTRTIANFDAGLDFDKRTDKNIVTQSAAIHIDGLDQSNPVAENDVGTGNFSYVGDAHLISPQPGKLGAKVQLDLPAGLNGFINGID